MGQRPRYKKQTLILLKESKTKYLLSLQAREGVLSKDPSFSPAKTTETINVYFSYKTFVSKVKWQTTDWE